MGSPIFEGGNQRCKDLLIFETGNEERNTPIFSSSIFEPKIASKKPPLQVSKDSLTSSENPIFEANISHLRRRFPDISGMQKLCTKEKGVGSVVSSWERRAIVYCVYKGFSLFVLPKKPVEQLSLVISKWQSKLFPWTFRFAAPPSSHDSLCHAMPRRAPT